MNNSRTHVPDRNPTQTGDDSRSFRLDSERGASPSGHLLKRLLLLFWAIYFSMVALTNLVNLLNSTGAIHWSFLDSGNLGYMLSIVKIYHVGQTPTKLLLARALVLEVAAVFMFALALLLGDRERELRAPCYCAGVWVLFIVMTEFFLAYAVPSLFIVFALQGVLLWVVSLPVQAAVRAPPSALGPLDLAGAALWAVGVVFESVGDLQLARFKRDPESRGKVMDRGLWRYTRHPNYFGDATVWWALGLVALGAGGAAVWGLVGSATDTLILTRVSGKPILERDIEERRPGYRDYIERTSGFFPLPPRSRT